MEVLDEEGVDILSKTILNDIFTKTVFTNIIRQTVNHHHSLEYKKDTEQNPEFN